MEVLLGSSAGLVRGARRSWPLRRGADQHGQRLRERHRRAGGILPGGTATLTGQRQPMTTTVDAGGLFRFLKVPPGRYTVTVALPGFTTVTRENVIVTVGSNTQVEVQLRLSAVQEAVTVTSATPLLDPRKVETGQNFSREELQEIPTSRDVWSLIQQVPGVQVDTVNVGGNQSAHRRRARTSSRRARATSSTRSTAPRRRTTPTATRSSARTAARTRSSTSRRFRTSRSRPAGRSSSSRPRA